MIKVIKKGGERAEFDLNKIKRSLILAMEQINLSQKEKEEIVDKITEKVLEFTKNKSEVFSAEIEAKILLELEKLCPEAVKNWREYRVKKEEIKKVNQ
mgnify:CR=1 FL=1